MKLKGNASKCAELNDGMIATSVITPDKTRVLLTFDFSESDQKAKELLMMMEPLTPAEIEITNGGININIRQTKEAIK